MSSAGGQVADHRTEEILGDFDFDLHHRLKKHRIALLDRILEGHRAGNLKCHLRRVHIVVGPIDNRAFDINQGITSYHARLAGLLHALLGWLDVFLGNGATNNFVDEFKA